MAKYNWNQVIVIYKSLFVPEFTTLAFQNCQSKDTNPSTTTMKFTSVLLALA